MLGITHSHRHRHTDTHTYTHTHTNTFIDGSVNVPVTVQASSPTVAELATSDQPSMKQTTDTHLFPRKDYHYAMQQTGYFTLMQSG